MRVHLTELQSFAFCPLHHRKAGRLQPVLPEPLNTLKRVILYLYSRQLEVGYKISWEEAQNAWNRSWWRNRDLEDRQARKENNQALIGLQQAYQHYREDRRLPVAVNFPYRMEVQGHLLLGEVPLILSGPDEARKITMVDVGMKTSPQEMTRDLRLRAASLMVQQSLGTMPVALEVLCFNRRFDLNCVRLHPTLEFQQDTLAMISHLVTGMVQKVRYPNRAGCPQCQFSQTCIA